MSAWVRLAHSLFPGLLKVLFAHTRHTTGMAQQTDPRNVYKIILPPPSLADQSQTAQFTFVPALRRPVVRFFIGSTTLLNAEHDQTIEISIAPPVHATGSRPLLPFQEDLDIVLSDTNLESDEKVTIVSFVPAPGPSGPMKAIIPHDSDDIDVSDSELESDSEDVMVSLFSLLHFSLSWTQGRQLLPVESKRMISNWSTQAQASSLVDNPSHLPLIDCIFIQ